MPRRLSTKISISILGVLALALLSSGVALMAAWRLGQVMVKSVRDNLPSLQAADDLEVALLEQRGFVSSYILDHGNPRWIDELAKSKPKFDRCYATARKTALRPDEFLILDELLVEFARYDTKRNEVITLFDQ
ncbi:MAG TPA: MCP four helix bundle domain-containing protein, partial [Pirellulales bacterium]|nr:MCP four helix bundle domain-containing protein [Pirellulales bacterium]